MNDKFVVEVIKCMKQPVFLLFMFFYFPQLFNAQTCNIPSGSTFAFQVNGKNYEIVKVNKTWTEAAACAVERGGKLAEILSQQENDSLFHYALNLAGINASNTIAPDGGGAAYLWIGGNDLQTEGTWIWDGDGDLSGPQFWQGIYINGTPVGGYFNAWGSLNGGEPDDFNDQDGLGLALTSWPFGNAGEWNDINVNNSLYFIIEYPANTTGLAPEYPAAMPVLVITQAPGGLHGTASAGLRRVRFTTLEGKLLTSLEIRLAENGSFFIPADLLPIRNALIILSAEFEDGKGIHRKIYLHQVR